ncbi:MAG: hypothetical protein M2R45_04607 [Verrucomicrobia subdivision 3 bacterium]|nr:hypothetical protein [Limisphaerales bacterium]MCS1417330.1 hypothetical protein [Limisphaerales bacterium]
MRDGPVFQSIEDEEERLPIMKQGIEDMKLPADYTPRPSAIPRTSRRSGETHSHRFPRSDRPNQWQAGVMPPIDMYLVDKAKKRPRGEHPLRHLRS